MPNETWSILLMAVVCIVAVFGLPILIDRLRRGK